MERELDAEGADPAREERELRRFTQRTVAALAAGVGEDGVLRDAAESGPTPPDHYAATWLALALALGDAADARWPRLVSAWAGPGRGHAPFNRLALLLLRDALQRRGQLEPPARELLERALGLCRPARRDPSNNWRLLAAACTLLEAPQSAARAAAAQRFRELVARWSTSAGGFIDYPAAPGASGAHAGERAGARADEGGSPGRIPREGATPLTYHAKALWLLSLVGDAAPEGACPEALARGTAWMLAFTDEAGRFGGFGRSSHALFGQACALALFARGMHAAEGERSRRAFALGARRLRLLLEGRRRDDGLLALTPAGGEGAAAGWDEYMHLSVYNAWCGGLLAWTSSRAPVAPAAQDEEAGADRGAPGGAGAGIVPAPDSRALGARPERLAHDAEAGLLALRGRRGMLCLSLQGQPTQGYGLRAAELRYGGMLPFQLVLDGRPIVAPPCRVPVEALRERPALAGWTPIVAAGERLFGLLRFGETEVRHEGALLAVTGRGAPVALHAQAPARGSAAWLAETADHHLLGGRWRRARGTHPEPLPGFAGGRAVLADLDEGWLAAITWLAGAGGGAAARAGTGAARAGSSVDAPRFLDPHGRGLLEAGSALPLSTWLWRDGWREDARADEARVALPCSMPGATGECGAPMDWPADDLLLLTLLGPAHAAGDAQPPAACEDAARRAGFVR